MVEDSPQDGGAGVRPGRRRLQGLVAVVVGGGQIVDSWELPGTGAATAILMAAEGAEVVVTDIAKVNVDRTVEEVRRRGGTASGVVGDAASPDDCSRVAAKVIQDRGRIDILVNNVGRALTANAGELSESDWDLLFNINVKSAFLMSRRVIPAMCERGGGAVVNIGSTAGSLATGQLAYGASKAALVALTRDLAQLYGPQSVRVNCVIPGPVRTPMGVGLSASSQALRREITMLRRSGTGWDIGWAGVFLASQEARFITATTLTVDGGMTAQGHQGLARRIREQSEA